MFVHVLRHAHQPAFSGRDQDEARQRRQKGLTRQGAVRLPPRGEPFKINSGSLSLLDKWTLNKYA